MQVVILMEKTNLGPAMGDTCLCYFILDNDLKFSRVFNEGNLNSSFVLFPPLDF